LDLNSMNYRSAHQITLCVSRIRITVRIILREFLCGVARTSFDQNNWCVRWRRESVTETRDQRNKNRRNTLLGCVHLCSCACAYYWRSGNYGHFYELRSLFRYIQTGSQSVTRQFSVYTATAIGVLLLWISTNFRSNGFSSTAKNESAHAIRGWV